MLDDLFSSSKGPGLIGLVLGMIVLAGFCGLGLAVFDGRLNGDFANSRVKESAKNKETIDSLLAKLKNHEENEEGWKKLQADARKLGQVQRVLKLRKPQVPSLKAEVASEEAANQEVLAKWEAYKERYREFARGQLVGEKFDKLVTAERTFEKVRVRGVTALELKIAHAEGATGVKLANLDDELRDRLQYSEEKAREVAEKIAEDSEKMGAAAEAAERIAALNALISHSNLNIELNEKKILGNDRTKLANTAQAEQLEEKARLFDEKHRQDRLAGRPSRADDNAEALRVRAGNLTQDNQRLGADNAKLRSEIGEYREAIAKAEREREDVVRKSREQARNAASAREESVAK